MSGELVFVIVGTVWLAGIPVVLYLSHRYEAVKELYFNQEMRWLWPATSILWLCIWPFYLLNTYVLVPLCKLYQKADYNLYKRATGDTVEFEEYRRKVYPTEEEVFDEWKANILERKEAKHND